MEKKQRKSPEQCVLCLGSGSRTRKASFLPSGFCRCFDSIEERKAAVEREPVQVRKKRGLRKRDVGKLVQKTLNRWERSSTYQRAVNR
jgi:hypothetical protein